MIMSKFIKPLGDRIVLQREEVKQTKNGIILPETAKEKPAIGKVIAIGSGKTDAKGVVHPLSLKVGDKVLFSNYAGVEYKANDQEYLILSEEDVLAVLNNN
jgi:chaperonin GroES